MSGFTKFDATKKAQIWHFDWSETFEDTMVLCFCLTDSDCARDIEIEIVMSVGWINLKITANPACG